MKEIKRIIDNHIYILKLIRKGSGWFPLFLIFFSVLRGFNTFFMTTWIYQYVINALQKGEKLTKIAVTAGAVFVFTLAYNALLQFKNAMMEIESGKIEKELQTILQKKALSVDLGCFERPKFYDSYVKALSETSQRAMKVLDNFCDLIVDTITVCSIGVLIFQIDPIFVLLAVLPFIGTLLLGGRSAIARKFSLSGFWPEMNRTRATIASLLGTITVLIANDGDRPEAADKRLEHFVVHHDDDRPADARRAPDGHGAGKVV